MLSMTSTRLESDIAPDGSDPAGVSRREFGTMPDGTVVDSYTLTNPAGMSLTILTYGGALQSVEVPDRDGRIANVALGFSNLDDYLGANNPYLGCLIGRFANRISGGRLTLDGTTYQLPINVGSDSLHGGVAGFDKKVWAAEQVHEDGARGVRLTYTSPDGEQGYPGTLETEVTYLLTDTSTLRIHYRATTDKPTIVNLTNHTYYNLAGEGSGTVLDHVFTINADHYLPVNEATNPTGDVAPVEGTPMDFRTPEVLGKRIRSGTEQLVRCRGYDHTYVLNRDGAGLSFGLRVVEPVSGRSIEVWTTEPGIDFYSGSFLDGGVVGTSGRAYRQGDGFVLGPEKFVDSPNIPHFPSTVLRPGEVYDTTTELRFSAQ
jgi:aldose 1-epimerase